MPLPSFFQRFRRDASPGLAAATDAVPLSASEVEAARVRARRRLVGMVVLVGAGVIGFPWMFETQPRQMGQDVQIVQADGEPGVDSQGRTPPNRSARSVAGRVTVSEIVAPPAETGEEPPAASAKAAEKTQAKSEDRQGDKPAQPKAASDKSVEKPPVKATEKAADKAADKPGNKDNAKPAQAKADKPADKDKSSEKPADKTPTRYVVQFGAFAEVSSAHEARMKIERLGIKTYAQQIDTPAGKRIRVRMGPYTDKAEADKAMATLRKAGLTGALLTL